MRFLIALLLTAATAFPQEIIVTANGTDFGRVQKLLNEGWKVKAQSSVISKTGYGGVVEGFLHVFTLTPPPPEVLAANEERARLAREAAWKKKREEFEKSRQVEKSK